MAIKTEVLRYLGHRKQELSPELDRMIDECMQLIRDTAKPLHSCRTFNILHDSNGLLLEGTDLVLTGDDIRRHLEGCQSLFLLAATLGVEVERLLSRYESTDITTALVLDACATQLIEEYCDQIEDGLRIKSIAEYCTITSRFSPGYGDLPLAIQPKLLAVLNSYRKIGLSCATNFLMIPRKSVSAVIGIGKNVNSSKPGCETCNLFQSCDFSKGCNLNGFSKTDKKQHLDF